MASWTTTDLANAVKRGGMIPTSQLTFLAADFCAIANEELQTRVTALILKGRGEFWATYADTALVSGTKSYALPSRAVLGLLREVSYVNTSGDTENIELVKLAVSHGKTEGFRVEGNNLILLDDPGTTTDSLRMSYYFRPGTLVPLANVGVVESLDTTPPLTTVHISPHLPTGWVETAATYDIVRPTPPFSTVAFDQSCTGITTGTMTFSPTIPTEIAVGDHVCLRNESAVPQIPVELHHVVAAATLYRVLLAHGDLEMAQLVKADLAEKEQRLGLVMEPRVQGEAQKMISDNTLWDQGGTSGKPRSWLTK